MAQLDRIQIKGFKSIREMDLKLQSLNVLIGANGAGKSNFISVFRLLNQIVAKSLRRYVGESGGADALLHYGQKVSPIIEIDLTFGQNGYQSKLVAASPDKLIFGDETVSFHMPTFQRPKFYEIGAGNQEANLFLVSSQSQRRVVADYVIAALESWKVYHFHDTSRSARVKATGDINDNERLRSDASNLAAYLYWLREREADGYQRIVQTIRLIAPFFTDFILRPQALNSDKILLEWKEEDSDNYFNGHSLSDSTLRFICLCTLLLQPDYKLPSTVLIDEPELGLHPTALTVLAALLKSAATRTQVIVSTQSVPLVSQFEAEDLIVVDRKDKQSTFTRLDAAALQGWLEEYSLGELWEKNVLGGRP